MTVETQTVDSQKRPKTPQELAANSQSFLDMLCVAVTNNALEELRNGASKGQIKGSYFPDIRTSAVGNPQE